MNDTAALVQVFCSNTYTVADMRRRLGLLRECVNRSLFSDQTIDPVVTFTATLAAHGREEDVVAVTAWGDQVMSRLTVATMQQQMAALQAAVDALPVMTLYIPVSFPESELALIAAWCREAIAPDLLFAVRIDPKVAGGCAFVWNNNYYDFSFTALSKKQPHIITRKLNAYV